MIIVVVVTLPVLVLLGRLMVHGRATDATLQHPEVLHLAVRGAWLGAGDGAGAAPMGSEPPHPVSGP